MKTKLFADLLLLILSTSVLAASTPMSATDRVNSLANEEAGWRYASGVIKVATGALLGGLGYTLLSANSGLGAIATVPFGIVTAIPGVALLTWGGADLILGSREFENQNDKLKQAAEAERENKALTYLKDKAAADHQGRQPSFWNGFGLFSMVETPAEQAYNAYLKDRGQTK